MLRVLLVSMVALAMTPMPAIAAYKFEFHYDERPSYASADIVYSADTLNSRTLTYVSGGINGYVPLSFEDFGSSFYASSDFSKPAGSVASLVFYSPTISGPGVYETNRAGRGISYGPGSISYVYDFGRLTISEFSYFYNFHYDSLPGYSASDVVFSKEKLGDRDLKYVSGSINGYVPSSLQDFGGSFYSSNDFTRPAGSVASLVFYASDISSLGNYKSDRAGRGISESVGSIGYHYVPGLLSVTAPALFPPDLPAIPEPGTWALMSLGVGLVGAIVRRRGRITRQQWIYA